MTQAMEVAEAYVKAVFESVLKNRKTELEALERDPEVLKRVIETPFPRMTYDEAVAFLQKKGFEFPWGEDFGAPHETALGEGQSAPTFITHFPTEMKGFYFKKDPTNPKVILGFDLIAPDGYGEIIGGSEREADLKTLLENVEHHNLPKEAFNWYFDLRRYGSVPHSGFGLGLERLVTWIAGTEHVREAIPFPRMLNRISP